MKKSFLQLAASFVTAAVFCVHTASAQEALSTARKAELTNLVLQDCGSCHGMTLKGGLGKPLLPEFLVEMSQADVAEIILDGVPGTPMPPWRDLLSKADVDWIAMKLKKGIKK